MQINGELLFKFAFFFGLNISVGERPWDATRALDESTGGDCSGGINISSSSGWNQFRYRCLLRWENRSTVLPCTRTARGINTSAADEPNQFMDPSPRSMYGSSQSFNVNTIDFEQLVLVQFWLWVTTFFQRGTRPLFLLCLIWMGHVLCCEVFLNANTNALHKHRQSRDMQLWKCAWRPMQKCRICSCVCRKEWQLEYVQKGMTIYQHTIIWRCLAFMGMCKYARYDNVCKVWQYVWAASLTSSPLANKELGALHLKCVHTLCTSCK